MTDESLRRDQHFIFWRWWLFEIDAEGFSSQWGDSAVDLVVASQVLIFRV